MHAVCPKPDGRAVRLNRSHNRLGALFKKRDGDVLVTNARDSGGHALCGMVESANRIYGSVEERVERQGESRNQQVYANQTCEYDTTANHGHPVTLIPS